MRGLTAPMDNGGFVGVVGGVGGWNHERQRSQCGASFGHARRKKRAEALAVLDKTENNINNFKNAATGASGGYQQHG